MKPVTVDLDEHYDNDSFLGLSIGPVLINDAQPTNTLSSCKMQFRDKWGNLLATFSTTPAAGEGTITINNATTWAITVAAQVLSCGVAYGKSIYVYWDFETVDSAGTKITLYKGRFKCRGDVTQ